MADRTQRLNRPQVDLNLRGLLDLHRKEIMLSLNCHAIGRVQKFNAERQTIEATIQYTRTYFQATDNGQFEQRQRNYPVLLDVPLLVMGGGGAHLTMPIKGGEDCLILFNDKDMDNWFAGAVNKPVASGRLHSFADGIAIVGLHSLANSIADYDPDRAVLRGAGGASVGVDEKVQIKNAATSLLVVINGLIDILSTAFGVSNACPNTAAITALNAHKLVVQGLLES